MVRGPGLGKSIPLKSPSDPLSQGMESSQYVSIREFLNLIERLNIVD